MEDCEVRLGLVSVVVREQREAQGKLERTRIELETRKAALERMKAEISLRRRRGERAKVFLEGLKAGSILSGVVEADETMSLVKEELRRQEVLEIKRLALETEKMERLAEEISSHEDEVISVLPSLHISSPSRWFSLRKRWNTSRLGCFGVIFHFWMQRFLSQHFQRCPASKRAAWPS